MLELVYRVAERHGVTVRADGDFHVGAAWRWLLREAQSGLSEQQGSNLSYRSEGAEEEGPSRDRSIRGAVAWLRAHLQRLSQPSRTIQLRSGEWTTAKICEKWPREVAQELASFVWPIESESEVARLLACDHASPRAVIGFEFTAAIRQAYEAH